MVWAACGYSVVAGGPRLQSSPLDFCGLTNNLDDSESSAPAVDGSNDVTIGAVAKVHPGTALRLFLKVLIRDTLLTTLFLCQTSIFWTQKLFHCHCEN